MARFFGLEGLAAFRDGFVFEEARFLEAGFFLVGAFDFFLPDALERRGEAFFAMPQVRRSASYLAQRSWPSITTIEASRAPQMHSAVGATAPSFVHEIAAQAAPLTSAPLV